MSKVILICTGCGKPATDSLRYYDEADASVELGKVNGRLVPFKGTIGKGDIIPNDSTEGALVPKGVAYKASKTLQHFLDLQTEEFDFQYWLNLDDIKDHILRNQNWDKGYGCCGVIAVHDKPNRQCICGADIGYEFSECYYVKVFIPNTETTKLAKA